MRWEYLRNGLADALDTNSLRPIMGVIWGSILSAWAHLHGDMARLYVWFLLTFLVCNGWILDLATGSWLAIKTDTFRWKRWRDTLQKLALYAIVMGCALTVHVLGQAVTIGGVNILEPFSLAMPTCVVLSDIVSALRNLALLLPRNGMLRDLLWGLGKRGEDLASKVAGAKEADESESGKGADKK